MNDQCTMYVFPCSSEDEVILKADPHCIEAGESLREWREHWHKLYIVSYGGTSLYGYPGHLCSEDSASSCTLWRCVLCNYIPLQ